MSKIQSLGNVFVSIHFELEMEDTTCWTWLHVGLFANEQIANETINNFKRRAEKKWNNENLCRVHLIQIMTLVTNPPKELLPPPLLQVEVLPTILIEDINRTYKRSFNIKP